MCGGEGVGPSDRWAVYLCGGVGGYVLKGDGKWDGKFRGIG